MQLPKDFQDVYGRLYDGAVASKDVLAHCKRELMQAVWNLLLDPDFVKAYVEGQWILFPDGIERLVFPCIFAYSADYPEKFVRFVL